MAIGTTPSLRAARQALGEGRLSESRAECARLLARDPRDADALHLAAIVELQQGAAEAALDLVDRSLRERPGDSTQHQTRGLVLRALGRAGEAEASFARAVELSPDFPQARASLGHALLERGEAGQALPHLLRAVSLHPRAAEWHCNLALAQSKLGDALAARASLERALTLRPRFAQALNLRGKMLMESGETERAREAFAGAIDADAGFAEAHANLGVALLERGRETQAEQSLRVALGLAPHSAAAWNGLGHALRRQGRPAEALEAYEAAVRADARLPESWIHRGNMLREFDRIDDALASLDRAIELQPGSAAAHFARAIALLLAGDLANGWREYRWRLGEPPDDAEPERAMRRAREGGAIELKAEQGLGDVLFFLRWAPWMARQGARLRLRADPRLFPLLASCGVFDALVAENEPAVADALAVPLGNLPFAARDAATHPAPFPLPVDGAATARARAELGRLGPPPYVGIAWRAGSSAATGEHLVKAVPPEDLGRALASTRATLVSLQREPGPAETAAFSQGAGRGLVDRASLNADLAALLPLLAALDDYVGVSSTNVHLLAGLGKGARVLVPVPPEWRYGRAGEATPWFPAFRIYREERGAGWGPALARLAGEVASAWASAP